MKKLLACLLVLMLLPAAVFAEAQSIQLSLDMPENALVTLAQMVEGLEQADETLLRGIAKLINDLTLDIHSQENLSRCDILVGDSALLSFDVIQDGEALCFTCDALPETAFYQKTSQKTQDTERVMEALLNESDWLGLMTHVDEATQACLDGISASVEIGSFAGEAYSGGLYRMTQALNDRDLFVLMERLLHYDSITEYIPALPMFCELLGIDFDQELEALRRMAFEAAEANEYSYILHTVGDGTYRTGLSLTAHQQGRQIGSISVGYGDLTKIVLGYGYSGMNVYFAAEYDGGKSLQLEMVKDEQLVGWSVAREEARNVLLNLSWSGSRNDKQEHKLLNLSGALLSGVALKLDMFSEQTKSDTELLISASVNDQPFASMMLRSEAAEEMAAPINPSWTLVEINSNGMISENVDEELNTLLITLGVRLIQTLPPELLMMTMDLTN